MSIFCNSSTNTFEIDLISKSTIWTYSSYLENYSSIESEFRAENNQIHACGSTEIYPLIFPCHRWLNWFISGNILQLREVSLDLNLADNKCFIRLEDKFASVNVQYTQYENIINMIVTIANRDGSINKIILSLKDLELSVLSVMIEMREGNIISLQDTSYANSKASLQIISYRLTSLPPNTTITCYAFDSNNNHNTNFLVAGLSGGGIIITTFQDGINKLSEVVVRDVSGLFSLWTGIVGGAALADTIAATVLSNNDIGNTTATATANTVYALTLSSSGTLRIIDLESRQCKGQLNLPATVTGDDVTGLCVEDACLDAIYISNDSFLISVGYDCRLQNRRKWIAEVILVNINRNATVTMQSPVMALLPPQFLESSLTPSLLDMRFERGGSTSSTSTTAPVVDGNSNNSTSNPIIIYILWKISGMSHVVKYVTPDIISSSTSTSTWDNSSTALTSSPIMTLQGMILKSKENEEYFPIKLQPAKLDQVQVAVTHRSRTQYEESLLDSSYHSSAWSHQYNEENIKAMMLQKLFSEHQYPLELIAKVIVTDIPLQFQSSFALQLQSYFQSQLPISSQDASATPSNSNSNSATWYQNSSTLEILCEETLSICTQWAYELSSSSAGSSAMEVNLDGSYSERKHQDDDDDNATRQYTKNLYIAFSNFIELCQKRKQRIQQGQFAKMRTRGSLLVNVNGNGNVNPTAARISLLIVRHYKISVAVTLPVLPTLLCDDVSNSQDSTTSNVTSTTSYRSVTNNNATAATLVQQLFLTTEALYEDYSSTTSTTTTGTIGNQEIDRGAVACDWTAIERTVHSYLQTTTYSTAEEDIRGISDAFRAMAYSIIRQSSGTTSLTSKRSSASPTANVITFKNILKEISTYYPQSINNATKNIFQILIEVSSFEILNNQTIKHWNHFFLAKEGGRTVGGFSSSTGTQVVRQSVESYILALQYKSKLACLCLSLLLILEEEQGSSGSYQEAVESYYLPKAMLSLLYSTYLLSLRPLRLTPSLPLHQFVDVEVLAPLAHPMITSLTVQSLLASSTTSATATSATNPLTVVEEEEEEAGNISGFLWDTLWTTISTSYLSPSLLANHQKLTSSGDSDLSATLRHCLLALQPSVLSPILSTLSQLEQFHSVSKLSLLVQLAVQIDSRSTTQTSPLPFPSVVSTLQPLSQLVGNSILTATYALSSLQNCLQNLVEYSNPDSTTNTNYIKVTKQKAADYVEVFFKAVELQLEGEGQYWNTSVSMIGYHTPTYDYYTTDVTVQIIQQWLKVSLQLLQESPDSPYYWKDHFMVIGEALCKISTMPSFLLLVSTFSEVVDVRNASLCHRLVAAVLHHCPKIIRQLMGLYHKKCALEIIGRSSHESLLGGEVLEVVLKLAYNNVHTSEELLQSFLGCQSLSSETPAATAIRMTSDADSEEMKEGGEEEGGVEIEPLAIITNEVMKEIQSSWSSVFSCALNKNDFEVALHAICRLAGIPPVLPVRTSSSSSSSPSSSTMQVEMDMQSIPAAMYATSFIPHWRSLLRALIGKVCSTGSGGLSWLCQISSTPLFPIEFRSHLATEVETDADEALDQSSSINDISVVIAQELEVLANTSDVTASLHSLPDTSHQPPAAPAAAPSSLLPYLATPSRTPLLSPLRATTTLWSTATTADMEVEPTALLKNTNTIRRIDYYECYTLYLLSRGDFRGAARAQHLLYERLERLLEEKNDSNNSATRKLLLPILETMASALAVAGTCLASVPSNQAFIIHRPLVAAVTGSGGSAGWNAAEKSLRVYTRNKLLLQELQILLEISLRKYYSTATAAASILPGEAKMSLPELIKLSCMSGGSSALVEGKQSNYLQFKVDVIMNAITLCDIWKQVEVEVANDPSSFLMGSTSKDTSTSTTSTPIPMYEVLLEDCIAALSQLCSEYAPFPSLSAMSNDEREAVNIFGVWLEKGRFTKAISSGGTSAGWELLKSVLMKLDGPHGNWQLHSVAQSTVMKYLPGYRLPEILLLKDRDNKLVIDQSSNWKLLELLRSEGRLAEACELGVSLLKEISYDKDGKDPFVFYHILDALLFTCSQFIEKYAPIPDRSNSSSDKLVVSVAYDNFEYHVVNLRSKFTLLQRSIEYHFSMIQIVEWNN